MREPGQGDAAIVILIGAIIFGMIGMFIWMGFFCCEPDLPKGFDLPDCYRVEKFWDEWGTDMERLRTYCELPPDQQECALVYYWEEHSGGEISESLPETRVSVYDCDPANH